MSFSIADLPLPVGTKVRFDIAQGLDTGEAVLRQAEYDEGWLYLLDVVGGSPANAQRNEEGELWVWEGEVTVI